MQTYLAGGTVAAGLSNIPPNRILNNIFTKKNNSIGHNLVMWRPPRTGLAKGNQQVAGLLDRVHTGVFKELCPNYSEERHIWDRKSFNVIE